jgi:hypothetical protein
MLLEMLLSALLFLCIAVAIHRLARCTRARARSTAETSADSEMSSAGDDPKPALQQQHRLR